MWKAQVRFLPAQRPARHDGEVGVLLAQDALFPSLLGGGVDEAN